MNPQVNTNVRDLAEKIVTELTQHPEKAQENFDKLVATMHDVYEIGAAESSAPQMSKEEVEEKTKSLLLSKTFWGIVISGIATVAPHLGFHLSTDQQTTAATMIVTAVGTALGIYGRISATHKIV